MKKLFAGDLREGDLLIYHKTSTTVIYLTLRCEVTGIVCYIWCTYGPSVKMKFKYREQVFALKDSLVYTEHHRAVTE